MLNVPADFEACRPLDATVPWIHRRAGETDVYFVANPTDRPLDLDVRFRVSGREPELWHPDTGEVEPAPYAAADGRVTVPLHLTEGASLFVVFRRQAAEPSRTLARATRETRATLAGPWDVAFPPGLGAPPKIRMTSLDSWTASADDGVKFFSGTATYTTSLQAPKAWFRPGTRLLLDLGSVRDLAEVTVNGRSLAILWKPPYEADVTGALKPGTNEVQVKVTNEWTNRLAGDRLAPAERRILAPLRTFGEPPGPSPSGLIGPVRVVSIAPR
jgi:hypothetical protein